MDTIELARFAYTPFGTFGELRFFGEMCYTLEPMWMDNLPNVSCIPTGNYALRLGVFMHNTTDPSDDYATYEILKIPGRQNIKFHLGNTARDTRGCPLLGNSLGQNWSVADSRGAFDRFMNKMDGVPEAILVVTFDRNLLAI